MSSEASASPVAEPNIEAVLQDEIIRLYGEVAENPGGDYHFYHGREAAELFDYDRRLLEEAPEGAVASFAGVGNPHLRAGVQPGETVLDVGSGAGLDAYVAARAAGPEGQVLGVDLNPAMCRKAREHVQAHGLQMTCHEAPMERIPVEDRAVDVVISNGVLNLSFRTAQVMREMFRVLRPGGRLSITDIVTGRELSQDIVNDPKLWAS
ncbi:MAG: methyltransferase domain-containing protein [Gemmatimonadota bacterium]|nr:methyltransferase domain-containing protein [Gemmatimonadota bacterium]